MTQIFPKYNGCKTLVYSEKKGWGWGEYDKMRVDEFSC